MYRLSYLLALMVGVLTLHVSCQDKTGSRHQLTPEQMAANQHCHFASEPLDEVPTPDPRAVTGQLTIYTFIPPSQYKTYLEDFNRKCPNIKLNIVYGTASHIAERLIAEKLRPQADVIWGLAVTNLILLEWQDLLYPYRPADLEQIRPDFRDSNKPPYWVGFDAWMVGICVNPAKLQALGLPFPISWSDLANPVYKDQIILYNPLLTGTGFMVVTHMLHRYGEVDGWAFLDALHHNIASYTRGDEEACDLVAAGDKPIGISYDLAGVHLKAQGKPIEVVFPVGLSAWDMEASALVKKEYIKPAAKTFLDWAISKDAMQAYAKNYSMIARRDVQVAVPEGFPQKPTQQLFDRDFLWDAANRRRILDTLRERYRDKVPQEPERDKAP